MMNFFARVARFLFWLLVVSWSMWLLAPHRGLACSAMLPLQRSNPRKLRPRRKPPTSARRLVRDPVCGMHVDETLSIPLREGGELLHFCSTACRDAYAVQRQKAGGERVAKLFSNRDFAIGPS